MRNCLFFFFIVSASPFDQISSDFSFPLLLPLRGHVTGPRLHQGMSNGDRATVFLERSPTNVQSSKRTSLCVHVSILVRGHLCQTEHSVLTLKTVVVSLFARMLALDTPARLAGRELLETSGCYAVQFRVLSSMSDHLVRIRADEVAFQTVEVGRFVLHGA